MDLASFYINLTWFCPTTTQTHGGTWQERLTKFDLNLPRFSETSLYPFVFVVTKAQDL